MNYETDDVVQLLSDYVQFPAYQKHLAVEQGGTFVFISLLFFVLTTLGLSSAFIVYLNDYH